jgi:hypothetical protein
LVELLGSLYIQHLRDPNSCVRRKLHK